MLLVVPSPSPPERADFQPITGDLRRDTGSSHHQLSKATPHIHEAVARAQGGLLEGWKNNLPDKLILIVIADEL